MRRREGLRWKVWAEPRMRRPCQFGATRLVGLCFGRPSRGLGGQSTQGAARAGERRGQEGCCEAKAQGCYSLGFEETQRAEVKRPHIYLLLIVIAMYLM